MVTVLEEIPEKYTHSNKIINQKIDVLFAEFSAKKPTKPIILLPDAILMTLSWYNPHGSHNSTF